MLFIFSLALLVVVQCRILELKDTELYTTGRGGYYFNDQQITYKVVNENGFNMELGHAAIKFEISDEHMAYEAKILEFKKKDDPYNEPVASNLRQTYNIPNLFDKNVTAAIIRHNFTIGTCLSMEAAVHQLHQLNLQMRLLTGYRTNYDEKNSYISPKCNFDEGEDCFRDAGTVATCGWAAAVAADPTLKDRKFSTRVHYFKGPFSWSGMGVVANDNGFINPSNRWALVHLTDDTSIWTGLSTAFHEVGHNMGYNHAHKAPTETRFLRQYVKRDGYGDVSNYMGSGNYFYTVPGAGQFMRTSNKNSLYLPWMKPCENGIHTYRLYAWDYAYTRVFLGDDKRITHRDNDIVDGLLFKYHSAAVIIEYGNDTFNSKLSPLKHGSISLEYHWFSNGLESYKNHGLKIVMSDFNSGSDSLGTNSMFLYAEVDDQEHILSSELPLNYLKVPEVDIGTMKLRILRFHAIKDIEPNADLLNEFPKQKITAEDLPYLDIEITHLPNVPFTKPNKKAPVPDVLFSPSLINCNFKEEAYHCEYFYEYNYWTYIKQGPSRNDSLPRFNDFTMSSLAPMMYGRLGQTSYSGKRIGEHQIVTGTMDKDIIRRTQVKFTLKPQGDKQFYINYRQQCSVSMFNKSSEQYEPFIYPGYESKLYDVVLLHNYDETLFEKVTVRDIYFNDFQYPKVSNANLSRIAFILMKPLQLQSFSRLHLSLVKNGEVSSQHIMTRITTMTSNRISISNYNKEENSYLVGTASMTGFKTANAFVGPVKVVNNLWYYYPFIDMDLRDFLMIDFEGKVPSNLILTIETENGLFQKDLGFLSLFSDASTKIQALEISQQTGGWSEIYRFRFNSEVTLLSLRLLLRTTNSAVQPDPIAAANLTVPIGEDKYLFNCSSMTKEYQFTPFNINFLGNNLTFKTNSDEFTVKEIKDSAKSLCSYVSILIMLIFILV